MKNSRKAKKTIALQVFSVIYCKKEGVQRMKEKYEQAEIQAVEIEEEDVILTSGEEPDPIETDGPK